MNDTYGDWPWAYYHRVHEPNGDGWDVICTEHGRIAGGPGALSLDKLEALKMAEIHDQTCALIAAKRAEVSVKIWSAVYDAAGSEIGGQWVKPPGAPIARLTADELHALDLTAELAGVLRQIIGDGPQAEHDWSEMARAIHQIQHAVMSQLAHRAYPDRFRLLGG